MSRRGIRGGTSRGAPGRERTRTFNDTTNNRAASKRAGKGDVTECVGVLVLLQASPQPIPNPNLPLYLVESRCHLLGRKLRPQRFFLKNHEACMVRRVKR